MGMWGLLTAYGLTINWWPVFLDHYRMDDWKDRGWRRADKKPVKNRQLWQQVDELSSRKYVEVEKVKAHSGIEGNERADSLASDAARNDID